MIIELGRIATGGYYDYQGVRIGINNRMRDVIRRKVEGIPLDHPEEKKEKKSYAKNYTDKQLKAHLQTLAIENKLTNDEGEYINLLDKLNKDAKNFEKRYQKLMEHYISKELIWTDWLKNLKGVGTVIASNLLKEFDYCQKYITVSSLWKHCGLHIVNGKAPKIGKNMEFNPKLRTMCWKIADSFVKQRTIPYRSIYDHEKEKQLNLEYPPGVLMERYGKKKSGGHIYKEDALHITKGHAENRARRKMIKIFLQHYWVVSRKMKKLDTKPPYVHSILKHNHYIPPPNLPGYLLPFDPIG